MNQDESHSIDSLLSHRFFFGGAIALLALPLTYMLDGYIVLEKGRTSAGLVIAEKLFPVLTTYVVDYFVYLLFISAVVFILRKVITKLRPQPVSS